MGVNLNVVFHRHGDEPCNLATEPINCTNVCYTVHHQLLILVYVKLMTKIVGSIWDRIHLLCCCCPTSMVIGGIHSSEGFTHPLLADTKAL